VQKAEEAEQHSVQQLRPLIAVTQETDSVTQD
jgi:hypothetical protein